MHHQAQTIRQLYKKTRHFLHITRRLLPIVWRDIGFFQKIVGHYEKRGGEHILQYLVSLDLDDRKHAEFKKEVDLFNQLLLAANRELIKQDDLHPCLDDRTTNTPFDRHYIYHPAWAARVLAQYRPKKHIDISSTLHFSTIVSAFLPVDFYDFRRAALVLPNMESYSGDLTQLNISSESIESLSCMHVLEHIGLGRYGDPYDIYGDKKAANELIRVLAPGGILIITVPVGRPRIQFNAHRVYSQMQVIEMFSGLVLKQSSLIKDGEIPDGMIDNPSEELVSQQNYGCGCYVFEKRAS